MIIYSSKMQMQRECAQQQSGIDAQAITSKTVSKKDKRKAIFAADAEHLYKKMAISTFYFHFRLPFHCRLIGF